jgi:hypothetical protein
MIAVNLLRETIKTYSFKTSSSAETHKFVESGSLISGECHARECCGE